MPGPLLPVFGPLLPAALISLGLRRWPLAAGICGFFSSLLLRFMIAVIPLQSAAAETSSLFVGNEFVFMGRALLLTEAVREIFIVVYTGAALLFLFSAIWPQGPDFAPAGLAALSPLALALQVQPFTFGVVAFLVAAACIAAMIQAGQPGSTLASLRYLFVTALALPAFLIAGWLLESQQFVLAGTLWRLMLLGLTLLLGGFPFHIWIRPLLNDSKPFVAVYVLAIAQLAAMAFAWQLFQRYPSIQENIRFSTFLGWSGAASALVAALLAANARSPEQLIAYLALADIGTAILSLSFGMLGIETALTVLLLRLVSLTMVALGLSLLQSSGERRQSLPLIARGRWPWGLVLFTFGALSLAGFPLTPGFPGRWAATRLASDRSLLLALPLLLATAGGTIGLIRNVIRLTEQKVNAESEQIRGHQVMTGLFAALLGAGFILAVFPRPFLHLASRLAALF